MFTTWQQIEDWIKDNQFDHWIFSRNKPTAEDKMDKIVDSDYYAGDFEDKIAMTRKYLESNGGCAYGVGYKKPNIIKGGTICEVRLEQSYPAQQLPMNGIGNTGINEAQLRETIKRELEAEWDKREYKRLREELDNERKAFEADKNSAIGLITGYLAPVAKAMLEKRVAGLDADAPIEADPVKPIVPTEQPEDINTEDAEQQQNPFTEEEEEQVYDLMVRFKAAEPNYLELIKAVVEMAERGDAMYGIAKQTLLK